MPKPLEWEKELEIAKANFEKWVSEYKRLKDIWLSVGQKHVWVKNEDGEINDFYLDEGFHNGPGCEICGDSFCEHCESFKEKSAETCLGPTTPAKTKEHILLEYISELEGKSMPDYQRSLPTHPSKGE